MKITFIEARDLPDSWFQCLGKVINEGREYTIQKGSYEGQKRKELDFVVINIKYPGTRPLLPEIPPTLGIPQPVTEEYLNNYLPYLFEDTKSEFEEYTYGTFLKPQIQEVIKMYKNAKETNQAYMTVGNPETIYMEDPPCLRGIDTRIRYGKLHFFVYFRSWDLWNGYPANLGALQILKEYMASEIGVEDGEMVSMSKGLHLYDYTWNLAKRRLGKGYA